MLVDVVVPTVGESISEVDIAQWRKTEGASVRRDDALVIIETDKATLEIPAPESGVLAKILKKDGDRADVGEVIGRIELDKVSDAAPEPQKAARGGAAATDVGETAPAAAPAAGGLNKAEAQKEAEQITGASALEPHMETAEKPQPASPNGERRSETADHEESAAAFSGRSMFEAPDTVPPEPLHSPDAEGAGEPMVAPQLMQDSRPGAERAPQNGRKEEVVPMSALRRRIAQRLVQAQQSAALLTTFNEIDMSKVRETRQQYREAFERKHNVKLGIMSFFVKATVASLKAFPQINAEIRGDRVVYRNYYDIGIAVGGGKGLVVPVLRDAEHKSFADIEKAIADFARRAAEAGLNPDDLEGGTFTVTNGGIYGSLLSTPIVNPPQSAILGMHAIQDRPVARDGAIVVRPMMYVALTYDHRLVDGREAVSFLKHIKELVEEPARILFDI